MCEIWKMNVTVQLRRQRREREQKCVCVRVLDTTKENDTYQTTYLSMLFHMQAVKTTLSNHMSPVLVSKNVSTWIAPTYIQCKLRLFRFLFAFFAIVVTFAFFSSSFILRANTILHHKFKRRWEWMRLCLVLEHCGTVIMSRLNNTELFMSKQWDYHL